MSKNKDRNNNRRADQRQFSANSFQSRRPIEKLSLKKIDEQIEVRLKRGEYWTEYYPRVLVDQSEKAVVFVNAGREIHETVSELTQKRAELEARKESRKHALKLMRRSLAVATSLGVTASVAKGAFASATVPSATISLGAAGKFAVDAVGVPVEDAKHAVEALQYSLFVAQQDLANLGGDVVQKKQDLSDLENKYLTVAERRAIKVSNVIKDESGNAVGRFVRTNTDEFVALQYSTIELLKGSPKHWARVKANYGDEPKDPQLTQLWVNAVFLGEMVEYKHLDFNSDLNTEERVTAHWLSSDQRNYVEQAEQRATNTYVSAAQQRGEKLPDALVDRATSKDTKMAPVARIAAFTAAGPHVRAVQDVVDEMTLSRTMLNPDQGIGA